MTDSSRSDNNSKFDIDESKDTFDQSSLTYKGIVRANKTLIYKSSPLDYIDLKYVKPAPGSLINTANSIKKITSRAMSQLGSEKSFRSSDRSFTSSFNLKNPYISLNSTPRTLADAFKTSINRPQLKVEYLNIVSDASLIPKYLSSTIKLESLKRDECNRNFEKTFLETKKSNRKDDRFPIVRESAKLERKSTGVSLIDKKTQNLTSLFYYINEFNQPGLESKNSTKINENSQPIINLQSATNIYRTKGESNEHDEDYHNLNKTLKNHSQLSNDYEDTPTNNKKNDYVLVDPNPVYQEDSFLKFNFSIQRSESEYETFKAIKKRVKFFEKVEYFDANKKLTSSKNMTENKESEINKLSLQLPQHYQFTVINNHIKHDCKDSHKKKRFKDKKSNHIEEIIIERSDENINMNDAISKSRNDSPLLESYKKIVNKSIEHNKNLKNKQKNQQENQQEKSNIATNDNKTIVKYKHLLDKLLDKEKEAKRKSEKFIGSNKVNIFYGLDLKMDDTEDPPEYDSKLSPFENWLLKWSIIKNVSNKNLVEIFKKNDIEKKGYLVGESLRTAINSTVNLTNLKLSYFYSILSLCGIEGANLKLFNVIIGLAFKVNYLDDEWFKNLLPQLDLSSVENKLFKALNMWRYLVNPTTKTLCISDLMIEFEAGCVSREHIEFAKKKFINKSYFDITDYLTYIPLFIYIHDRIIKNPFFIASEKDKI